MPVVWPGKHPRQSSRAAVLDPSLPLSPPILTRETPAAVLDEAPVGPQGRPRRVNLQGEGRRGGMAAAACLPVGAPLPSLTCMRALGGGRGDGDVRRLPFGVGGGVG